MDDASYLAGAANVVSTNTKMGVSNAEVAKSFQVSADAQIAAAVKSSEAMRLNALNLRSAANAAAPADRAAASALAARAETKYARSIGDTTVATRGLSGASKTAERDINKFSRGVLAGSGVLSGLGRSLAFASSGFIAASLGAAGIVESIKGAESLEKAQASLAVAIRHTGGNLAILQPQYEATAKAAAQFGVSEADATTGLARATVLTGNAGKAQRAYQEALVISKATGKDFNAVLTATAKGQEGITTSLRRYGILIDKGERGTAQFNQVMARFGGQAAANTTSLERLHAAFTNTLATIGLQLLPTVNRLASSFANWLTKMNESGRLQKDVAAGMTLIKDVTGPLIDEMHVLGQEFGFANDGLRKLSSGLKGLSGVKLPAFLGGGSPIPGGGGGGFNLGHFLVQAEKFQIEGPVGVAFAIRNALKGTTTPGVAIPPGGPQLGPQFLSTPSFAAPSARTGLFGGAKPMTQYFKQFQLGFAQQLAQVQASLTRSTADDVTAAKQVVGRIKTLISEGRLRGPALVQALSLEASALSTIWSAEDAAAQKRAAAATAAKAKIAAQIQNSIDPLRLEVALSRDQSRGANTTADLKALRAAAEKAIASGKLTLAQQKQAYDQITSLNTAIKDSIQQGVKAFIEPLRLQVALAREQAFGTDTTKTLKAMKAAALKAVRSGKYSGQALIDLYNQIASINQQLGSSLPKLPRSVPAGTVGAEGYAINAKTGQPLIVHTHIDIDGRRVADNTTRHQQRRHSRNPVQRRGPNAGG